jgi:hypothetical protein
MVPMQQEDTERVVLIQLREHLAAARPAGVLARLKWWLEVRRADGMLEYEDTRHDGADVLAPMRRWTTVGLCLMFGVTAIRVLFFSTRLLTLGRAAQVLGLTVVMTGGTLLVASRLYRRQARQIERAYQRWLERARALPASEDTESVNSSNAAV